MTVLKLMLTLTLFHLTLTAAKAQKTPADPGANAALKYWDGFALLPTMDHELELKLAEERKTGGWQAVWNEVLLAPVEEPGNPIQEFAKSVNSFEQAQKVLADHLALNDQLAKISGLPWKEFDVQYPEFVKRMKSVNPQAGFLLPNLEKFIPAQRRCLVQISLFKAALAVVQGGHDKLQEIQDPFGDGPFEYRRRDNGFELKSKLVFKGVPVALTVGRPSNR